MSIIKFLKRLFRQLADYNLEDGLILLENKLGGTIQDFTINDTYAFYAKSGVLQNRMHYISSCQITTSPLNALATTG
jgi:hypothetical protein